MAFSEKNFLSTLADLIALGERLQNSVDAGKVPCEMLAVNTVLARLAPHIQAGRIKSQVIASAAHPDRPNLLLTLPGRTPHTLGFVGAHFDVVPAEREAEGWLTSPFQLVVESDGTLRGRGVTDCLGHVALLTELLFDLAESGITPNRTLKVLMIANEEESSIRGIGLDYAVEAGVLSEFTAGPLFWLDSADFGPTLGTGGIAAWELTATGVPGHSGMPQHCVNALELAMTATLEMGKWFSVSYPPHAEEARYRYASASSLKATIIQVDNSKVTKIPGLARVQGDIRMTPFYDINEAVARASEFVDSLNNRIALGREGDPMSRFRSADGTLGRVVFTPKTNRTSGIACDLESEALRALTQAIVRTRGEQGLKPWAMTGSLPLVRDLQRQGYDVQITGFGRSVAYHAPNEFGLLSDFAAGYDILRELVDRL